MTSIQYVKFALVSLVQYNVYMDIIKEELVEKLKKYFFDEFEKKLHKFSKANKNWKKKEKTNIITINKIPVCFDSDNKT